MNRPVDTISSDEPGPEPAVPSRRGSADRLGVRATALSAALTLVFATGIATAAYRGAADVAEPTALIPSSAFAVATVDLGLPAGQSDALAGLLDRFPHAQLSGDGSIRDKILRSLLHSSDPRIDYDSDVKPWLGDHAAVAGWQRDGKPEMEIVLQSTDDSSARRHLNDLSNGDASVVMHDGYAVLGSSVPAATDAIAAASRSSLAETGPYAADIGALPDNEAITGWFDGPAAAQALRSSLPGGTSGSLGLPGLGLFGGGLGQLLKGRLALGVHVSGHYAQLDMRTVGGTSYDAARSSLLTQLPAGTVAGIALGDPGAVVDAATGFLRTFESFAGVGISSSCVGVTPPAVAVPSLSAHELRQRLRASIPPGTAHRQRLLHRILAARHRALVVARHPGKKSSSLLNSGGTCTTHETPAPDPLAEASRMLGLQLPEDAKTLLGDGSVVAYGGLTIGVPDIAIRSHPTDLEDAQRVADNVRSALAANAHLNIAVGTAGEDLVLATSEDYEKQVAAEGSLGDSDRFRTALGDIPDQVTAAGYADLSRVWPLLGDGVPDGVTHLKAVGFWADSAGEVQRLQFRLVIG